MTAALVVPEDERAGTLLLGRFVDGSADVQLIRPRVVVGGLMETIFRIKGILDGAVAVVGAAAVLALVLVFALSFRLREPELSTNFALGASRSTTARMLGAELVVLAATSALIVGGMLLLVDHYVPSLVRSLFIE